MIHAAISGLIGSGGTSRWVGARLALGKRLRSGAYVLPIGIAIIALTLAIAAISVYQERQNSLGFWRGAAESESRMLAAHAWQTMVAADLVLRSVTERANDAGVRNVEELHAILGTASIHELLRERQKGAPQVSVASIVERNGDMVNFTRSFPPRANDGSRINLLERDYFQAHLANPKLDLFVSKPVQNKGTGTWTFYLARKIRSPSGEMLGLVLAGIESAYFVDFYDAVVTPGRRYSIYLADGTNLARNRSGTDSADLPGADFQGSWAFKTLESGQRSAVIDAGNPSMVGSLGNALRILAPSRVRDYPLVVTVRISDDLILGAWRRSMLTTLAFAGGLSLVVLMLTIALRRMLAKNDQAMRELVSARRRAESASRAKSDFLANMSHEIRTPMNAVIGLTSVLADEELPVPAAQLVSTIGQSAGHLLSVVNDILDFSSIDAGQLVLRADDFDVRAIVAGAVSVAKGFEGASGLDIRCDVSDRVPGFLRGDAARVTQVLLNLLSNAVKFTQAGSVRLDVTVLDAKDGKDGGEAGALAIVFSVADTGRGVATALRERIFEPFEQGERGTLAPHGGTGLGLAISRRIARQMGGELIVAESGLHGSTFVFTAPFDRGQPPVSAPVAAPVPVRGRRILVAEDTPASQMLIRLILEGLGHTVHVVDNGSDAVRAFSQQPFDAVFMDIQMPLMDGLEATRIIRGQGSHGQSVPIVALSAHAQDSDREAALARGVTVYLAKPVRKADIARVLDTLPMGTAQALSPPPAADGLREREEREPPIKGIDQSALNELADAVGQPAFDQAVESFVQDALASAEQLRALRASGDAAAARRIAHRLKGLFVQFGALSAAGIAAELEQLQSDDVSIRAQALLAVVQETVAGVRAASRLAGAGQ